jgi:hypothetical protein
MQVQSLAEERFCRLQVAAAFGERGPSGGGGDGGPLAGIGAGPVFQPGYGGQCVSILAAGLVGRDRVGGPGDDARGQFVRGYGPLSAGVRLLPVALAVGAGSMAGTQLAVRAGTKLVVTAGLVAMAGFYGWVAATASAAPGYGVIAAQMVLYGLGMGLTSAPATESIMGAISRAKAGVGSAVNDSTRLLGGTLGVAVIGSVYASVYGSRLTATLPAAVPGRIAALAHQSADTQAHPARPAAR